MADILDTILAHKRDLEVPARKLSTPLSTLRTRAEAMPPARDFGAALRREDGCVALIAEVKRASPSRGVFVQAGWDPAVIARDYEAAGAAAISVLTDERFFKGHLDYLTGVKHAIALPALRKDFMVDAYQLFEARAAGADAALLIVSALDDALLPDMHAQTLALGMTALVEVHDESETERALRIGARVIGVNNRNLRTFTTDLSNTAHCARALGGQTLVSESGIFTQAHVRAVADMGAHAILVGESIITSPDRVAHARLLARVPKVMSS